MTIDNKLDWAIAIISQDCERELIGIAAQIVLTELEKLQRGEFICKKCALRKDSESMPHGEF